MKFAVSYVVCEDTDIITSARTLEILRLVKGKAVNRNRRYNDIPCMIIHCEYIG